MALSDDFEAIDLAMVERYVSTGQEEHLSLDFKRLNSAALTDQHDKEHLAKALSGFANADGGLVVWGVATVKGPKGIEAAAKIQPVDDLDLFIGRLNEFTGVLANPRVEGVRHRKVPIATTANGVAVSLIPASDSGPHMAKAGLDHYYRRHGDRFLRMEHYEVADMFGRRPRPDLRVTYALTAGGSSNPGGRNRREFRVTVSLENVGRGSAAAPFAEIFTSVGEVRPTGISVSQHTGTSPFLERVEQAGRAPCFVGRSEFVIHPGTKYDIAVVLGAVNDDETPRSIRLRTRVAAQDYPLVESDQRYSPLDVLRCIGRRPDDDD